MILVGLPEGGLLADLEHPAEIFGGEGGHIADRARWGGVRLEKKRLKTERPPTNLRLLSERPKDSASLREMPMILNALVSTA